MWDVSLGLVSGPSFSRTSDDRFHPLRMECREDHPEVFSIDPSSPSPLGWEVIKDTRELGSISPAVWDRQFRSDRYVDWLGILDIHKALPPCDDTLKKVQGAVGI